MAMYLGSPSPMPGPKPGPTGGPISSPWDPSGGPGRGGSPVSALPGQTTAPAPTNVLGPQAIRPSGSSSGFDPQYLQNLATAIGGLFSRPSGNLSFNPLGNLGEISPSTGGGTAPVPGLPSTMLQDALQGLAFMFNPPSSAPTPVAANPVTGGGNYIGGGRGRSPFLLG